MANFKNKNYQRFSHNKYKCSRPSPHTLHYCNCCTRGFRNHVLATVQGLQADMTWNGEVHLSQTPFILILTLVLCFQLNVAWGYYSQHCPHSSCLGQALASLRGGRGPRMLRATVPLTQVTLGSLAEVWFLMFPQTGHQAGGLFNRHVSCTWSLQTCTCAPTDKSHW